MQDISKLTRGHMSWSKQNVCLLFQKLYQHPRYVLAYRINADNDREFLIKWADCGPESNTWEPAAEFYIDGEATTIVLDYCLQTTT